MAKAKDDDTKVQEQEEAPVEATEESKQEQPVETESQPAEETKQEVEAPEKESEEQPEEPEEGSEEAEDEQAKKKKHNAEMAKKRVQSKKRTEQELAQDIQQEYPAKTEQDYKDEGLSEREAQLEARLNNFEYQQEVSKIARLNTQLQDDAQRVYKDFPMFDPKDKENYDPEFAQKVEDRYRRVARFKTEKLGEGVIVTNAEEPLYDFYAEMAEVYQKGSSKGASKGQDDALKMMSRAEQPSNQSTPKSGNKKFEDLSIQEMEQKLGFVRR
jgi:hypothetical protein